MPRNVLALLVVSACFLTGCGTMNAALNETTQVVEYYRVFDVRTSQPREPIIKAARLGLERNAVNIQDSRPIPPSTLPSKPGRFTTTDPSRGSSIGALAGAYGQMLKSASCDGSVWLANATRSIGDASARIAVCVWQYTEGYHLDIYATYLKREGGIGLRQMAGSVATSIVGTFEEALEKTVNDVAREVQSATGAAVAYVEGYPEPIGEPWWAKGTAIPMQQASPQPIAPTAPAAPFPPPAPRALVAGQLAAIQAAGGKLFPGGTAAAESLAPWTPVQLISKTQNANANWWFVDTNGRKGYVLETDLIPGSGR
ncbi:MAG: hypothetical protein AABY95_03935 [Pseudomonadota bacterium]